MKKPESLNALEEFGRVRLSKSFFMRDFLYSEISNFYGKPNIPSNPDLAIAAGEKLCVELLEPLQETFGRIAIRSSYRSEVVNEFGNQNKLSCASNAINYAGHIWDHLDENKQMGATACIVIPWFADKVDSGNMDWRAMAWWIHDNLPHAGLYFFPKLAAFNISWHENPSKTIHSYIEPRGCLTKPGMDNFTGDHSEFYQGFPELKLLQSIATR